MQGRYFIPDNARFRATFRPKLALVALGDKMIEKAAVSGAQVILNLYPVEMVKRATRIIEEACSRATKAVLPKPSRTQGIY